MVALVLALALADGCGNGDGTSFSLYTHCGIDEVRFEGEWYERVGGPLDDGSGNPPPGWDNPEHEGTMTRVTDSTIVFTDDEGHREEFRLREGATEPKQQCG